MGHTIRCVTLLLPAAASFFSILPRNKLCCGRHCAGFVLELQPKATQASQKPTLKSASLLVLVGL